jgi:hypothetical protein
VREVEHARDTPDQGEADGHQRELSPEEEAVDELLCEQFDAYHAGGIGNRV